MPGGQVEDKRYGVPTGFFLVEFKIHKSCVALNPYRLVVWRIYKEVNMGYEKDDAKETGDLGEGEARRKLEAYGLMVSEPDGPDVGIDFLAYFPERPDLSAKLQVKGRRKIDSPRWFSAPVAKSKIKAAYEKNMDLEQLWRDQISLVDFWLLVSIPLNEIWVLPYEKTIELAELNNPHYITWQDNQFDEPHYDKYGKLANKKKELNLDQLDKDGQKLTERFKFYLNNFDQIGDFLKRLQ